ncbi:MAG: chemotaxis protein CheW [Thermodesulfobacteriota bacterium]|nr:chemotaxis protein CheW [Thermodesulfobacteriota bacterium]
MQSELITKEDRIELITFYIGNALCGIDITDIQEINKQTTNLTWVPKSPTYVAGVLNLRGMIVTVVDIGEKLGLSPIQPGKSSRNIIVHYNEELVGILVDSVSEVLSSDTENIESAPANLGGVQGDFFCGVLKTEHSLIGILDIQKALSDGLGDA